MEEMKSQRVEEAISILQVKVSGRGSDVGGSNGTREEGHCVARQFCPVEHGESVRGRSQNDAVSNLGD